MAPDLEAKYYLAPVLPSTTKTFAIFRKKISIPINPSCLNDHTLLQVLKIPSFIGLIKKFLQPSDQKHTRPIEQKYIPPQDQKYQLAQDQKKTSAQNINYAAYIANQTPLPPQASQQQLYMPPSPDYKYPPSSEQRYIPPQQYTTEPSDQKFLPAPNKYHNRDLDYRRVEQEYQKSYPKYEQKVVERGLAKGPEENLADYQKMDKREE